jgi:hypothetical protein
LSTFLNLTHCDIIARHWSVADHFVLTSLAATAAGVADAADNNDDDDNNAAVICVN